MISFHCDCGLTEFSAISTTFALLTTNDLSQVNRLNSSNRFIKGKYRMVNAQPLSQDLCLGFWVEGKAKGEVLGPKLGNTLALNSYTCCVGSEASYQSNCYKRCDRTIDSDAKRIKRQNQLNHHPLSNNQNIQNTRVGCSRIMG